MNQLGMVAYLARGIHRRRLVHLRDGVLHRDPDARLHLAAGRDDPYGLYERIRAAGPLHRARGGHLVSVDHAVCAAVLRDRRFGVDPDRLLLDPSLHGLVDTSFLGLDPPDHTRLRRVVTPALGQRAVADRSPLIERVVDDLLDRAVAGADPGFDLMARLAVPLPLAVLVELLGVPDADADRFERAAVTAATAIDGLHSVRHAAGLRAATGVVESVLGDLVTRRRRDPGADLVSRVAGAGDDEVGPAETLPLLSVLLVAGLETVANLVGNAVLALLDRPDQWERLCADPARRARAVVEETLRHDPPVQRAGRIAREDIEADGYAVARGDYVVALLGGANRDPAVFAEPHRFDPDRADGAGALAFGGGIRHCVGRPLAVLQATTAVRRLAERLPLLRRDGPVRRRRSGLVRGPARLPVRPFPV